MGPDHRPGRGRGRRWRRTRARKLVGIVHAETSTGAHQPLEEIARLVHEAGALLLVDAVTSLGGHELRVDDWGIDACYSGTQKCLSCPPGLAPVTFSPAALDAMDRRKTKVRSWYLDMSLIRNYWGADRVYHHTAPINMTYALREALRVCSRRGSRRASRATARTTSRSARRARGDGPRLRSRAGAQPGVAERGCTSPTASTTRRCAARLLDEFGIEIGGGLGPFKGKAWRIGLMGASQHPPQRHAGAGRAGDDPGRRGLQAGTRRRAGRHGIPYAAASASPATA